MRRGDNRNTRQRRQQQLYGGEEEAAKATKRKRDHVKVIEVLEKEREHKNQRIQKTEKNGNCHSLLSNI